MFFSCSYSNAPAFGNGEELTSGAGKGRKAQMILGWNYPWICTFTNMYNRTSNLFIEVRY